MTGMPAWSAHGDAGLWATVAFVEKLPGMTEQEYAKLVMASHTHGAHHRHGGGDRVTSHDGSHDRRNDVGYGPVVGNW